MAFENYIQNLPLHQNFKKIILDANFLNSNPVYYQNYPSLFSNAFIINKEQLELLDISGYFYRQFNRRKRHFKISININLQRRKHKNSDQYLWIKQ